MRDDFLGVFAEAGCTGQICAISLRSGADLGLDADRLAVPASVIKVVIALAAEEAFAEGQLDARARVTLTRDSRTAGPVGFSLYEDDVEVSLRDLVVSMLTISDNAATDALLERVGLESCNRLVARLGMTDTFLAGNLATMIDSIARSAGFSGWSALVDRLAEAHSGGEPEDITARVRASPVLDPRWGTHTSARDMCRLLAAIWSDTAGSPEACARVRSLMAKQLTRHRIAAGMPPDARVSAKSGGLVGVVRNEIGVVEYPGRGSYAVAVFTRTRDGDERAINAAIGRAAAMAIDHLSAAESS